MARAVWWTLTLAVLASGARYGDYSEVKMPEYGSAIDYEGPRDLPAPPADTEEYDDHTRDTPAPFDYRDEENKGNVDKHPKEGREREDYQHYERKPKKYSDESFQNSFDHYSSEDLNSHLKSNQRPSKHRPKHKARNSLDEDLAVTRNKHVIRHSRNKKKDTGDIDSKDNIENTTDELEYDKNIDFENDKIRARNIHSEITVRTARRKPRDRYVKSDPPIDEEEDHIDNIRKRTGKDDLASNDDLVRGRQRPPIQMSARQQYRPTVEDNPKADMDDVKQDKPMTADRKKKKDYDYVEYYDMKRVQGIKNKLINEKLQETQRRRATTIFSFPMRTRPRYQLSSNNDGLEGLRRLMEPRTPDPRKDDYEINPDATSDEETHEPIYTTGLSLKPRRTTTRSKPTLTSTATKSTTTTTTTPSTTTTETTETTEPTETTKTTETVHLMPTSTIIVASEELQPKIYENVVEVSTDMSLAERSRLSILKKAQKKEMLKDAGTKKPPVLMQVTNRLHTLVMVEPATSEQPWQRVSEVHDDSPENILKVKRLMRKKLVANAKNIHDLAENWDDMICDYIDMSLLDKSAASKKFINALIIFLSSILLL